MLRKLNQKGRKIDNAEERLELQNSRQEALQGVNKKSVYIQESSQIQAMN